MENYHREILTTPEITLNEMRLADKDSLIKYINVPVVHEFTLTIPYPYKPSDADAYLTSVFKFEKENIIQKNWAIRYNGEMIGSLGLLWNHGVSSLKNEIGYWIGAPFRGKSY